MKKLYTLIALSIGALSASVAAQEAPPYENWVGGFAQYYKADSDKPFPTGGFDDGKGFGGELGFRFDPSWAVRFEVGRILIDKESGNNNVLADDGTQIGADIMYFLDNDVAYLFGGLREQAMRDSYRMTSAGIGKHWEVSENWRVITEAAYYFDFGQGYKEYSAKLGLAYIFGQSRAPVEQPDSDGDGVYDAVDRCPTTLPGTQVDATGCNVDLDGDGVLNTLDQCPRTASGVAVDETGCEAIQDADMDGVADAMDTCPNTPMGDKVNANGCSVLTERELSVSLDILFPNNSSALTNVDTAQVEEFVEFMRNYPNTTAEIQGHTSAVGPQEYNQMLSENRANAVKNMLVNDYGIDESRLTAVGYGETRLKFIEDTPQAHRLNRRIEAEVTAVIEEAEQR